VTRARWLAVVLVGALAFTGCFEKRIRKRNVDEVTDGMSKKQVESILGQPTTIDSRDWVISKKTIYIFKQGKDTVTLTFKDDKLQSKESTLND
jgi:outer membrane protein assembly factor BamE (lipoprotein component of BamABCDE complex)